MKIVVLGQAQETGEAAAQILTDLVRRRPQSVLGVATGSSPLPVYQALEKQRLDLSSIRAFALDEYVGLPQGDPQSYAEVIRREVTERLGLDPRKVFVPNGSAKDPEEAARLYEKAITDAGGIDAQILGIGHNGHIAFNEPGSPLDSRTRVEKLAERTREANARYFASLQDVPTHCITQGLGTILEAQQIILVVHGEDKAQILEQALYGPISTQCPASVLQRHPQVTLIADEAAARYLKAEDRSSGRLQTS